MPSSLQGLNIVQPVQEHPTFSSDSADLLSAPTFPELALWTNLAFESDEPFIPLDHSKDDPDSYSSPVDDHSPADFVKSPSGEAFDIASLFMNGFGGVDPFLVPPTVPEAHAFPPVITPTPTTSTAAPPPPAKKSRTQRPKQSPPAPAPASVGDDADAAPAPFPDPNPNTTTPLTAAEDKRRRNTAASARFRLKKKEREAALEKRSKELEGRVGALERECEALRRENGWLKGLVVGVTGGQVPVNGQLQSASGKRKREEEPQNVSDADVVESVASSS